MGGAHSSVEVGVPHRIFRWDTGLAFVFVLGIVSVVSHSPVEGYRALQDSSGEESIYYDFLVSAFFALLAGGISAAAFAVWVWFVWTMNRSKVRIVDGRITGTIFDASTNTVDIRINAIDSVEIDRRRDGRISSLLLAHPDGKVALTEFSDLEDVLAAIVHARPEGIEISEKALISVGRRGLWIVAGLACAFVAVVPIYLRDYTPLGGALFAVTASNAQLVGIYLFQMILDAKKRDPQGALGFKVGWVGVFGFAVGHAYVCVTSTLI